MRFLVLILALVGFVAGVATLFTSLAYVRRRHSRRYDCDHDEDLGLLDTAVAFVAECGALFAVLIVYPLARCMPRTSPHSGTTPIVLMHGWGLNVASLWWLRRRLHRAGFRPITLFGYATWRVDVARAAAELAACVDRLQRDRREPITLIAHSLGGLVARLYLRQTPTPAVHRLVTLGTPHQGTAAAPAWLPGVNRLHRDSTFITEVNAGDPVPDRCEVIAIHSAFDALVIPAAARDYPGAYNIEVRAVGHNALLFSRRVFELVAENLRA